MKDVNSPVNSANKSSKIASNQPMSPGARATPGGSKHAPADSVPGQPAPQVSRQSEEPQHGTVGITGPE